MVVHLARSIATPLQLLLAGAFLLILGIGSAAWLADRQLNARVEQANTLRAKAMLAERANRLVSDIFADSQSLYADPRSPADPQTAERARLRIEELIGLLPGFRVAASDYPEAAPLVRSIESFVAQQEVVVELAAALGPAAARVEAEASARSLREDMSSGIDSMRAALDRRGAEASRELHEQQAFLLRLAAFTGIALLFCTLVLTGFYAQRWICGPLQALSRALAEAGAGGSSLAGRHAGRRDEIGALARGVVWLGEAIGENERLRAALAASAERAEARASVLAQAIDAIPNRIGVFAPDGTLIYANGALGRLVGLPAVGQGPALRYPDIIRRVAAQSATPDAVEALVAQREAMFRDGAFQFYEARHPDGGVWQVSLQTLPSGERVSVSQDITALRGSEAALAASEARLRGLLRAADVGIWEIGGDGRTLFANEGLAELFGGAAPASIEAAMLLRGATSLAVRDLRAADGLAGLEVTLGERTALLNASPWFGPPGAESCVVTLLDVTELRRTQNALAHLARHDALTGLPNRAGFHQALKAALSRAERDGDPVALLAFDLDRFKEVNDTLGHPAGDQLLREAASRLRAELREHDTVARLGGDEFMVIQVGAEQPAGAEALAARLLEVMGEPYRLDGHQAVATATIGIAIAPEDGNDADQLVRNADTALYQAKAERRGSACAFRPEMDRALKARREMERGLRRALAEGEFRLLYQPQVAFPSRLLVGYEALIRWQHPERGLIAPGEFIALAEETGLIAPIGDWVLREACVAACAWPEGTKIAVNLSPMQFRHGDIVASVRDALAASGLPARQLELEITEGLLLQDSEQVLQRLTELKALGVSIAMDDFGTGYSSLAYLWRFPFDKLKIDQRFTRDMTHDPKVAAIVETILALGRTLDLTVTAEGVETEGQASALADAGCDLGQGYLIGRPLPAVTPSARQDAA
jgi:diguanylate cyclase (GGDEF)-like protein